MRERLRKENRRNTPGVVTLSFTDEKGGKQSCVVRGVDVSSTGVGVESPRPFRVGAYVQVHAEDYGLAGTACVRHCTVRESGYLVGLELGGAAADHEKEGGQFVDFYELMQISPSAETETIQRVYRLLVTRYHPDNPHTGDVEKFMLLRAAYETLSDPVRRAAYDTQYRLAGTEPVKVFELKEFLVGIDAEVNRRLGILSLLYNRRRTNPDKPGISLLEFEKLMAIPREHLVFTVWYLKQKRLLTTENSADFEVTADGVEFVESSLPSNRLLRRLLHAADEPDAGSPFGGESVSDGRR